jgi:hypothetical protein
MKIANEIPLDNSPVSDPSATAMEIARLWIVDGRPTFLIGPQLWQKPEMWGLLISDLIEHLGNAYQAAGFDRESAVRQIVTALTVERKDPTSSAEEL